MVNEIGAKIKDFETMHYKVVRHSIESFGEIDEENASLTVLRLKSNHGVVQVLAHLADITIRDVRLLGGTNQIIKNELQTVRNGSTNHFIEDTQESDGSIIGDDLTVFSRFGY